MFVPSKLGDLYIQRNNNGFYVVSDEKISPVYRYNIDSFLRDLTNDELVSFLNVGNLMVGASYSTSEKEEMEYTLTGYVRGLGGMQKNGKPGSSSNSSSKSSNNQSQSNSTLKTAGYVAGAAITGYAIYKMTGSGSTIPSSGGTIPSAAANVTSSFPSFK
ncbi:MAG: hypothetical protein K2W94_02535 [Alphaproteobacteria bacterium]|nr:hypothetical protein [Alphaproteobacteria bacterium]